MARDICFVEDGPFNAYTGIYDAAVDLLNVIHNASDPADWESVDLDKAEYPVADIQSKGVTDPAYPFTALGVWLANLKLASTYFDTKALDDEVWLWGGKADLMAITNNGAFLITKPLDQLGAILEGTPYKQDIIEWFLDYQKHIKYEPNSSQELLGSPACVGEKVLELYELGIRNASGKEHHMEGWLEDTSLWDDHPTPAARAEAMLDAAKERQDAREEEQDEAVQSILRKEIHYREQCFLLAKIFDITEHKRDMERMASAEAASETSSGGIAPANVPWLKKIPYYGASGNASVLIDGDPYGFMNLLTQHQAQSAFFDMKTEEISSLQPMMRFFKLAPDPKDPTLEVQREINFDSYASKQDVESLFADTTKRGFGAGIKNFSFTYDGSNIFSAKKSIKAKLVIFASSFDELLKDRGGYTYADLALKTGKTRKAAEDLAEVPDGCVDLEENLSKLNFRLKAVVGFARPSGDTSVFTTMTREVESRNVLDAINESYVTLNLTPTTHEFNIDDMGRTTFTINYWAYVEDFFDQPQFDIFYDEKAALRIMGRRYQYKTLTQKCDSKQVAEWKKKIADGGDVRRDQFWNMQSLLKSLTKLKKIRFISLSYEELLSFQSQGPFFEKSGGIKIDDSPSSQESLQKNMDETFKSFRSELDSTAAVETKVNPKASLEIAMAANDIRQNNISFFYVSDLIDTILAGIELRLENFSNAATWESAELAGVSELDKFKELYTHQTFKHQLHKFRVLLGPLEIVNPRNDGESRFINLGDIPVSVKYFMEWLSEKLTKKDQTEYNLTKFLNDFFNNLISNFLNSDRCFDGFSVKQKIYLTEAVVTSYKPDIRYEFDEITMWQLQHPNERPNIAVLPHPVLNISGPQGLPIAESGTESEINYLTFFAGRVQPTERMNGSRAEDESRGIFHYLIGRPRGIVKNVTLSRTDAKYLKEVRFQQEGFDGLEQLREVYDIEVDCFANVKTFPGTYIFIDPRGFAPNTTSYEGGIMDLTRYGIGGYGMIIRSQHDFSPGQADSKLTVKWVAQLFNEDECEATEISARGSSATANCPSWATNRLVSAVDSRLKVAPPPDPVAPATKEEALAAAKEEALAAAGLHPAWGTRF